MTTDNKDSILIVNTQSGNVEVLDEKNDTVQEGQEVIVKVQRPLGGENAGYLIYSKGQKNVRIVPAKPEWEVATRERLKAYFMATFVNGEWVVGRQVAAQSW